MHFYNDNRPPNTPPTITLDGKTLTILTQHQHLGIICQHNLRWTHHIEHILRKTYKSLNLLFRLRSRLHHSALSRIYTTHILPILQYACIAVTPVPSTALDRLERFQRKAAKVYLRLPIYSHFDHSSLLHRIQLPTIFCRRKIKHIVFSHAIHYMCEEYMEMDFECFNLTLFRSYLTWEMIVSTGLVLYEILYAFQDSELANSGLFALERTWFCLVFLLLFEEACKAID